MVERRCKECLTVYASIESSESGRYLMKGIIGTAIKVTFMTPLIPLEEDGLEFGGIAPFIYKHDE